MRGKLENGEWQTYQEPTRVNGSVLIRARTSDNKRAGRTMVVSK